MANLITRSGGTGPVQPSRPLDPFEMMRDLVRWDPVAELGALGTREGPFVPAFEVKETRDAYVFKADLPGVREADLEISLTGNRLTLSGKRDPEAREEEARFYAHERSYGTFSRSFTLPEGVDPEHAEADLSSGVLTVVVPKRPEVKPRRIEVKGLTTGDKAHA
jgi:HSP20 family protein